MATSLSIPLDDDQRAALDARADAELLPTATWARRILLRAVGAWTEPEDTVTAERAERTDENGGAP
jgi:hypothetical protein